VALGKATAFDKLGLLRTMAFEKPCLLKKTWLLKGSGFCGPSSLSLFSAAAK
jgi:hypothetical protein